MKKDEVFGKSMEITENTFKNKKNRSFYAHFNNFLEINFKPLILNANNN